MVHSQKKSAPKGRSLIGANKTVSGFFAVSCFLGLTPSFAMDVPGTGTDTDLSHYINGVGLSPDHTYTLTQDVTLGSEYKMDANAPNAIVISGPIIDGERYKISRTHEWGVLKIYPDTDGKSITLQDVIFTSINNTNTQGALAVHASARNAILNLGGTTISDHNGAGLGYSGGLTVHGKGTQVHGVVTFSNNRNTSTGAAAMAVDLGGDLTFNNAALFEGNAANGRGGAATLRAGSHGTFRSDATFTDNSAVADGGAVWVESQSTALFEGKTSFTDNHASRGGALWLNQLSSATFSGTTEFSGNYGTSQGGAVWILNQSTAQFDGKTSFTDNHAQNGGALWLEQSSSATFSDYTEFSDNYGTSDGGAIWMTNDSTVTLASSKFTGNSAARHGGAIYLTDGTVNLNGDTLFEGNVHNNVSGMIPISSQAKANAIYVDGNNSRTATINMTTSQYYSMEPVGGGERVLITEKIHFKDPIESAAGRTVIVNHIGTGIVEFSGYDSDVLAQTTFTGGTFILSDGAKYGRNAGTAATSFLNMDATSTLRGHADTYIRAKRFDIAGRLESTEGGFFFEGGDLLLADTSTLAIHIFAQTISVDGVEEESFSSSYIDMGSNKIKLNDATLEVTADVNYVPSDSMEDRFTIVANLSADAEVGVFKNMTVMINGAEFEVQWVVAEGRGEIVLQQTSLVPEPSTYALLLAVGCIGFAWARRVRKSGTAARA